MRRSGRTRCEVDHLALKMWFMSIAMMRAIVSLQCFMGCGAALLPPLLGGCTGHGSEAHRADLSKLVGISEAELVRRLGQPDSSSGDPRQKFLVYDHADARYVNPSAGYRYDHDYKYGFGRAPAIAEFNCNTTFVIESGLVRAYDLTGNGCR
jgi:hypothetical protein